ncbi:MAG: hypothetical protein ABIP42_03685, partial [Planctomycetota bacterium]
LGCAVANKAAQSGSSESVMARLLATIRFDTIEWSTHMFAFLMLHSSADRIRSRSAPLRHQEQETRPALSHAEAETAIHGRFLARQEASWGRRKG